MASILPTGGTCEKYEKIFLFFSPLLNKNLSRFFKIPSPFARNPSEVDWLKLEKMAVLSFWGRAVLEG
jgi:hypothetical protein